jgi:non-reducing end alpha-L-arabinofuranosidase
VKRFSVDPQRLYAHRWKLLLTFLMIAGLLVGALGVSGGLGFPATSAFAAGSLPCDIYASGSTPCVAAHSTVRALYSAYNGNLYQVRRASDNTTLNIGVLSAGGYANAAAQDSFCAGTSCVITIIYDQSGRGNNLTQAPPGNFPSTGPGGDDELANATAAPITVGGHKAYGVYIASGMGYRNDNTNGIATGDNPEGEYAIFDGTHYNGGCCFDYGNAETDAHDDGNGTMEAIYFGNIKVWGYGSGNGPWVMADLENGLFSGANVHLNSGDQSITSHYVTAMVKGGPNLWAIKAGNAQSGGLTTMYNGPRPNASGYNPMHKQGAIILGIGGDNSHGATGTFYEGVMTSGYPSDSTESAVQASIVAAGYGSTVSSTPTPTPTPNPAGYAVNAGGADAGSFQADGYSNGGSTNATSTSIDTSGVTSPAPQAVYQTERYGNFTYTLPGLTPGRQYNVRLHFAEIYWTSSGQRTFNVAINGQQVLTNFDIYATAGAANKAVVEQYTATADANGQIAIQFTSVKDNAKISGIEVLAGSSATPTPTPTQGTTPTPTPTQGTTPTPTPTQGTTPTPVSGASCSVHYAITNQWTGGFGASVTITNTGSTDINGWSLQFSFPNGQTISQLWNGNFTQSGSTATITNVSYNGSIPAGQALSASPGFNGTWNGTNGPPTSFTLNGAACSVV